MPRAKQSRDSETVVVAVVSDVHAGSTVALMHPEGVPHDDGQVTMPSKAQRWLWQCWGDYWDRVEEIRNRHRAKLYHVYNGDLVDGPAHHGTTQTVSNHPGVEKYIAKKCLEVPKSLGPDKQFVVRGTEVHVGKSGGVEDSLAEWLGAVREPETGGASWWHLRMEVQGKLLDFAHHGRVGTRPWTKPNVTMNLAAQIFYEHASRGERHPDLAVRSHYHQWIDTYKAQPVRVIQTPAWQLHTAFTRRIATDSLSDIGGIILVLQDGRLSVEEVLFTPARGAVWNG